VARASRPWVRVNGKPCVVTERGSAEMAWPQALAPERSAGVGAGRLKCFGLVFAPFELLRGHHSGAWFRSPIPFNRGSLGLHGFDFNRRFDRLKALSGVEGQSSQRNAKVRSTKPFHRRQRRPQRNREGGRPLTPISCILCVSWFPPSSA
jgi:hypothetical protein